MERLAFSCGLPPSGSEAATRPAQVPTDPESEARLERLDSLAYRSLLAFIFVLFIRPQDLIPALEPLHLADLTGAFAAIALLAARLGRGAPVTRLPTALLAAMALGGMMLATAPFSVWPGGSVAVFTDLFSKVLIILALLLNTVTTRARFESLINVVVVSTSYIAVRAVLDYLRGVNIVEGGRVQGVGGLFGNPNDMALNMVAFLPLAVALALRSDRARRLLQLIALIGIPALAAAIIFTKSRGGTVALIAMLCVLIFQIRRLRPGIAVAVLAAALSTVPFLPESFTERMSSIFNADEDPTGSREARKRLLREGYQAFLDNAFTGLGAGQFQNYKPEERDEPWRETHNALLQVAAELGVVGLIIFLVIIGSGFAAAFGATAALRRVRRQRRARAPDDTLRRREPLELYAAALVASLTGWLVAAMFASVAYYWTLYLVLGLAVSLRDIVLRETGAASVSERQVRPAAAA